VVRAVAERYVVAETMPAAPTAVSRSIGGVYRPAILATTTVERAGYLFLDTPSMGHGAFEVRDGPQAGLRLGVFESAEPAADRDGRDAGDPGPALSLAGIVAVVLLWHYRLLDFQL
jgi:hypothetical protein